MTTTAPKRITYHLIEAEAGGGWYEVRLGDHAIGKVMNIRRGAWVATLPDTLQEFTTEFFGGYRPDIGGGSREEATRDLLRVYRSIERYLPKDGVESAPSRLRRHLRAKGVGG